MPVSRTARSMNDRKRASKSKGNKAKKSPKSKSKSKSLRLEKTKNSPATSTSKSKSVSPQKSAQPMQLLEKKRKQRSKKSSSTKSTSTKSVQQAKKEGTIQKKSSGMSASKQKIKIKSPTWVHDKRSKRSAASGTRSTKSSSLIEALKRSDTMKKSSPKVGSEKNKSKSNKRSTPLSEATKSPSENQPATNELKIDNFEGKKGKKTLKESQSLQKMLENKPTHKEQHTEEKKPVQSSNKPMNESKARRPAVIPQKFESKQKDQKDPKHENKADLKGSGSHENENNLMACSMWPYAVSKKQVGRLILLMRCAERVDRVFGSDWFSTEAPHGILNPTDLNVPNNVTSNQLFDRGVLYDNPPITTLGRYSTVLAARAMNNRGILPKLIICSPTLRAIQTGEELARFLKAKLAIEPGLVEPLAWYRKPGKETLDFRIDELAKHYAFDTKDYQPTISLESIIKLYATESEAQGLSRVEFVLRSLAGEQRKHPLIIVAHAVTLALATAIAYPQGHHRTTAGGSPSQITSFDHRTSVLRLEGGVIDRVNLGLRFPPGSVIALTQVNDGPPFVYELIPNVVPPLSYGEIYSNQPAVEA